MNGVSLSQEIAQEHEMTVLEEVFFCDVINV